MSGRHGAGDLRTTYDNEPAVAGFLERHLVRPVAVGMWDIVEMGLVLDVVGHRDAIEAVPLGFLDTNGGPHVTIGENGVRMEITGKRLVAGDVRKFDHPMQWVQVLGGCKWSADEQ